MEIICHRGVWVNRREQNSFAAFRNAFTNGFGIELDVRDNNSEIVVCHDMPSSEDTLQLKKIFELYINTSIEKSCIAINIKADGLSSEIKYLLESYGITNYFTFDMSIPENLVYRKSNLKYFTRKSDVEKKDTFLDKDAAGVWLDSFFSDWFTNRDLSAAISVSEKICVVSPELHGRKHLTQWALLGKSRSRAKMMLCTDKPFEAREYFGD